MPSISDYNTSITNIDAQISDLRGQVNTLLGSSLGLGLSEGDATFIDQRRAEVLNRQISVLQEQKRIATQRRDAQVNANFSESIGNDQRAIENRFQTIQQPTVPQQATTTIGGAPQIAQQPTQETKGIRSDINVAGGIGEGTRLASLDQAKSDILAEYQVGVSETGNPILRDEEGGPDREYTQKELDDLAMGFVNSPQQSVNINTEQGQRVQQIINFLKDSGQEQIAAQLEARLVNQGVTDTQLQRGNQVFSQARRGLLTQNAANQGIAGGIASRAGATGAQRLATLANIQNQGAQQVSELNLSQLQNERDILNNYLGQVTNIINNENAIRQNTTQNIGDLSTGFASDVRANQINELGFQRGLPDVLLSRQANELALQGTQIENQIRQLNLAELQKELGIPTGIAGIDAGIVPAVAGTGGTTTSAGGGTTTGGGGGGTTTGGGGGGTTTSTGGTGTVARGGTGISNGSVSGTGSTSTLPPPVTNGSSGAAPTVARATSRVTNADGSTTSFFGSGAPREGNVTTSSFSNPSLTSQANQGSSQNFTPAAPQTRGIVGQAVDANRKFLDAVTLSPSEYLNTVANVGNTAGRAINSGISAIKNADKSARRRELRNQGYTEEQINSILG